MKYFILIPLGVLLLWIVYILAANRHRSRDGSCGNGSSGDSGGMPPHCDGSDGGSGGDGGD